MPEAQRRPLIICEGLPASAVERLQTVGEVVQIDEAKPDALVSAVVDAEALLVRGRVHVTARIMTAGTRLRVIGRIGPSLDHIDLRVARERGIVVVYAPHATVRPQIEFTVAMILAAHYRLLTLDRRMRGGEFEMLRRQAAPEIHRQTVGLLGMNAVGEGVGRVLSSSLGCKVIWHDPAGDRPERLEATEVELETLLRTSDILSIHLSLTSETRHFLNVERLNLLHPTAHLINTSRGPVVDSAALAEMLKTGRLAGAALDVFEAEPLPSDHPIRTAPNCLLTPHVGGLTPGNEEAVEGVVEDVLKVLRGESAEHVAVGK